MLWHIPAARMQDLQCQIWGNVGLYPMACYSYCKLKYNTFFLLSSLLLITLVFLSARQNRMSNLWTVTRLRMFVSLIFVKIEVANCDFAKLAVKLWFLWIMFLFQDFHIAWGCSFPPVLSFKYISTFSWKWSLNWSNVAFQLCFIILS
jgi:hypothetical protein